MEFKTKVTIAAVSLAVVIVIVVPPAVLLSPRTAQFRATFKEKCKSFPETTERCERVLSTFENTYVGKDSCNFPREDYNQLFTENPFTHPCGKTMFWSGTKHLVDDLTEGTNHLITMQKTLLGHIMNDLKWCGKKGSKDTFIHLCKQCPINTVSSFWDKASEKFADYTCGHAHVMLDGFDPTNTFGAIEVRRLIYPRVQSLTVILVTKDNKEKCGHESLKGLRNVLDLKVTLSCCSVTESGVRKCIETGKTIEACCSSNKYTL